MTELRFEEFGIVAICSIICVASCTMFVVTLVQDIKTYRKTGRW